MPDVVIIGGCGHVGLPLGLAFARAGKRVVALDTDPEALRTVRDGRMPFMDKGADELLPAMLKSGAFSCTDRPEIIAEAQVLVTVIGTPVDEHLNPRLDLTREVLSAYRPWLRSGQLLIIRSTVFPGTTGRLAEFLEREKLDLDLAFCPERVAQGYALEEITSLPQIVAGATPAAQERAEALFRLLTPDLIPMSPLAAELTKLFANAWRYIQFAIANQFYIMASEHGIDFYEIHNAMTWKYPRAQGLPRAGFAAGPCLFKDTMQLSAFHNNNFFLGHTAMLVNQGLPAYLVSRAARRFPLKDLTVGILGLAFKGDSDDARDSLAYTLRNILQSRCRAVLCADPFLAEPWLKPQEEVVAQSQLLFVGAPHSRYKGLDFGETPVVDIWNIVRRGIHLL